MAELTLLEGLRGCDLLTSAQLDELALRPETTDPDPRALAKVVYDRGWMTRFQLSMVAAGRGKELHVGSYVLLDRIGEGGMGQVFKARHSHMGRLVALKLIRKEKLAKADVVARFNQEVRAAAQLSHPNIVLAFDAGQADDVNFFIMEYVDGVDLGRYVQKKGPLSIALACDFIRQAALGIQHAHERGLVHRDIKPSNLLVTRDSPPIVKILDMGLARLDDSFEKERNLTRMGQVLGTPDYLAPEQALDSRGVDFRADIYSLGCTLFFLLTGRPPFEAESLTELLMKHQMERPPQLKKKRPDAPPALAALFEKMMSKRPEQRPATAAEVAASLEPAALGASVSRVHGSVSLPPPSISPETFADLTEDGDGLIAPPSSRSSRDRKNDTMAERPVERKPSPKKKQRQKSNPLPLLIGAGIGAAVLLLVGIIVAIAMFSRSRDPGKSDNIVHKDNGRNDEKKHNGGPQEKARPDGKEPFPTGTTIERIGAHIAFKGHTGRAIGALAVSPEGNRAASAGLDGTIVVWDLDGEKALWRFSELPGVVDSIAFSADGRRLIASAGSVFLEWNLDTGEKAIRGGVAGARLDPAGRTALSFETLPGVSWAHIWDVASGRERFRRLPGPGSGKTYSAFDRTGTRALAIGPKPELLRYDLETGTQNESHAFTLNGLNATLSSLCCGRVPDEIFTGWSDGIIRYFPLKKGAQAALIDGRHSGPVHSIALSPDGRALLTTCDDTTVRLIEMPPRRLIRGYRGHNSRPEMALMCPNSQKAISADGEGTIILWDLSKPSLRIQIPGPTPPVTKGPPLAGEIRSFTVPGSFQVRGVQFSSDTRKCLSAFGQEVVVHDLQSGTILHRLKAAEASIMALTATKDWKRVLSSSADKALRLWDVELGKQEKVLAEGQPQIHTQIAVSPDGRYALSSSSFLSTGETAQLLLWNLQTGVVEHQFQGGAGPFTSIAFTDDGKYVVASDRMFPLRIWDLESKNPRLSLRPDAKRLRSMVKIAPAGKSLVLLGRTDGAIELWDCQTGAKVKDFTGKHLGLVSALAVSADGKRAVSMASGIRIKDGKVIPIDPTLRVWDIDRGIEVAQGELPERPTSLAISADGKLALIGEQHFIRCIDLTKLKPLAPPPPPPPFTGHSGKVRSIALSRDGKYLASGGDDGTVRIWDAATGKQLRSFANGGPALCVRFSEDGSRVVSFGGGQASASWIIQTGARVSTILTGDGALTVSGDVSNNSFYTVLPRDKILHSYRPVANGLSRDEPYKMPADITCVASLGDDARFAFGDSAGTIRLLNAKLKKDFLLFSLHKGSILSLACHSPTGTIVSGGADKRVAIFRIRAGVPTKPRSFFGHSAEVTGVALSADGKFIVSGSKDRTVRIWDMQGKEQLKFNDTQEVMGVAFDPSGKRVFSCGQAIRTWDLP